VPLEACDVGQCPIAKPHHTSNGQMHTLTQHTWLVMVPPTDASSDASERWLVPSELFSIMGFPISADMVSASHGADCAFSYLRTPPDQRTPSSQRSQIGNTIHVASMAAVASILYLKLPKLGEVLCGGLQCPSPSPTSSMNSQSPKKSAFGNYSQIMREQRGLKRERSS
jgi:hypothetical protein